MAVVGAAPCQCSSPGGNQTMSPGRISSIGPLQRWTQPQSFGNGFDHDFSFVGLLGSFSRHGEIASEFSGL